MLIATPSPQGEALDVLAAHCIAARAVIEEAGTPVMRRLIDLLLFEIAVAMADPSDRPSLALEPVA
ncbi:hypothetical protein ASF49_09035 [Methylobacterium sp. Leaf104]|uniref:hypothetical protein n=1 Tax=Methylobacterium TaxID=407 RepID=UPI0007018DEA|nr:MULTISPECIES: hypothetical protein [Methylobacterium]KQP31588.1 hypothetical protein ASF49_09035 [Methylobacterium sp. Leaf104]MCI9880482.1 hypothetical protein [Methylobacterium goesingense]